MQSNAESPGRKPRKSQVIRAELSIRFFSTHIGFGLPVEPLVCTRSVSLDEFHSFKKSSTVIICLQFLARAFEFSTLRSSLSTPKQLVSLDFKRHRDVVSEELSRAQALWHLDIRSIYLGTEEGNGIQAHVALQSRCHP